MSHEPRFACDEPQGPFERAMARVFDPGDHHQADVLTVTEILEHTSLGVIPERHLSEVAHAWLDAASFVRERGVVADLLVLAHLVVAMGGYAATHASDLIARASSAGQLTTAAERAETHRSRIVPDREIGE